MIDLFDEEILKPKKKKKIKPTTPILIAIVLLLILSVITLVSIVYLKATILTISVNGDEANELQDIFIIEENEKVYIPIRRMAEYLDYASYNGDYTSRTEDATKCYIETEEEVVSFTLDSNILTKVVSGQSQQIKITEPIKEINGELCITSEGAKDAFNFKFEYNVDENEINIQTLSFLYSWYSQEAVNEGYLPIEEESFENKTAIFDDMLIVKSPDNYYGVRTTEGEIILENKYESIQYLRNTSDFLVESNGKMGIISADQTTKVQPEYDSIERVTNKNDIFYVVGKSNLYGLLDVNGKRVIYPEYERIGVDVVPYEYNGVTNGYIFYNQLVPVQRNNKWGLFDIQENKFITDFIYDSFGCPGAKNSTYRTYGVIKIFDYNLIIGCRGEKYNLTTIEGKGTSFILEDVYIEVSEGKNIYYVTVAGETKELMSFLQENGLSKPTPIN